MKLWITLAWLLAGSVQAQTVWRCGPEGNRYSDSACADGRTVAVADTRSPAEVQAARAVAARERALAERLAADNVLRESSAGARLVGIHSLDGVLARNAEAARSKPAGKPFTVRLAKPAG